MTNAESGSSEQYTNLLNTADTLVLSDMIYFDLFDTIFQLEMSFVISKYKYCELLLFQTTCEK